MLQVTPVAIEPPEKVKSPAPGAAPTMRPWQELLIRPAGPTTIPDGSISTNPRLLKLSFVLVMLNVRLKFRPSATWEN